MAVQAFLEKLEPMAERFDELERLLADPEVISDQETYRAYLKEHGYLAKSVGRYRRLKEIIRHEAEAEAILHDEAADEDLAGLAEEELEDLHARHQALVDEIRDIFLEDDGESVRDAIVEIRAGTGGDEACLFAADLFRMYTRYAETKGWKTEIMSSNPTELQGFKDITFSVKGNDVFKHLRYESGGHRVQRVPQTEASGRVHTSACTVAVMPEVEAIDIQIEDKDLDIDTMRSSGPGGQSVNKLSSAVRITHIPTGTVVSCQDEKSQHKNRSKAMRILRSRLYEQARAKRDAQRSALRRNLIGSGDRSERVRTYNFPQNRMTDHRINFTLYDLQSTMLGDLTVIVDKLIEYDKDLKFKEM
jgi:peptide chain release factor 1